MDSKCKRSGITCQGASRAYLQERLARHNCSRQFCTSHILTYPITTVVRFCVTFYAYTLAMSSNTGPGMWQETLQLQAQYLAAIEAHPDEQCPGVFLADPREDQVRYDYYYEHPEELPDRRPSIPTYALSLPPRDRPSFDLDIFQRPCTHVCPISSSTEGALARLCAVLMN